MTKLKLPPMDWTEDRPIRPGWYWMRYKSVDENMKPIIYAKMAVQVYKLAGKLRCSPAGGELATIHALWWPEPIKEPKRPRKKS